MSAQDIRLFLSMLPLASRSEREEYLLWCNDFPLVLQQDAVEKALEAWLGRLKPKEAKSPTKENQPLLMTSAPTGSGKTIFLRLLCQLFRHGWDVDNFIGSLHGDDEDDDVEPTPSAGASIPNSGTSTSSSKAIWLQALRQSIETIKSSKKIGKLINSGELARSFLTSTHPCFVSFNSTSPITNLEIRLLGHSPEHMLIARIIFAELQPASPASASSPTTWPIMYDNFLDKQAETLLRLPPSVHHVVDFFRERAGCNHYLLAIDEVILLDGEPDTVMRERLATVFGNAADTAGSGGAAKAVKTRAASSYGSISRHEAPCFTPGVCRVLRAVGKVIMTDPRCAAIISSLVIGPLDEYVRGSQHEPVFIPLHPFLHNLADLADIIVERRKAPESFRPVMKMLLATGGHPKLLRKLIPWLSDVDLPCGDMTFANAAEICNIDKAALHEPDIANSILIGDAVSPAVVADISGLGGMLTRPTSLSTPSIIIASPLVLYVVASRHPACAGDSNGQRALKVDDLVPSEIRSGEDFEAFIAAWLTLRLRMGASLDQLLTDKGGNSGDQALRASLKVRHTDVIHEFVDWDTFVASLPSAEGTKVTLETAQRASSLSGGQRLFGMGGTIPKMRVAVPVDRQNPGFDILVGRCGSDDKRIMLVQCKAQEVKSVEHGGEGQTFTADDLSDTIRLSVATAEDLIRAGWIVTLVVIACCQTFSTVVSKCPAPASDDALHLYERTGVIAKAALRNLLGASFALTLEVAQGHVGHMYRRG